MHDFYSVEKNIQALISLMKAHGVRRVVVSPGTTNITLVGSLQNDDYFILYSSVDERSAAYMACGLAAETGEPVALSCTGATASRNYIPGLTEAYYRKLPVLAITSTQHPGRVGTYTAQVVDRSQQPKDIVLYSAQVMVPHTKEDEWAVNLELNKALLSLQKNGGGPVHINLMTTYNKDFSVKELPPQRIIRHFTSKDAFPKINAKHIGIKVGAHIAWSDELTKAVDKFCENYGAVVFCEHISNYHGSYKLLPALLFSQEQYISPCREVDLEIYIGYVEGYGMPICAKEVWRVNPDGEIRDKSHKTTCVFQMEEIEFFNSYINLSKKTNDIGENGNNKLLTECGIDDQKDYLHFCKEEIEDVASKVPELPFSNAWIAQQTGSKIPEGSILHLGILNTMRTWNFFPVPESINCYANTGGFGIDGDISSLVGASLAHPDKLYFGIVGDLAFFYDMNVLGNRYLGNNVRLMLINNGRGTEFRNYNHFAARFGEAADLYMAAAGHFGNQSRELVKHYASDLGFEYLCADSKKSYLENIERFLTPGLTERPMLFEVFTDSKDESDALKILYNIKTNAKGAVKKKVKKVLGEKGTAVLTGLLKNK